MFPESHLGLYTKRNEILMDRYMTSKIVNIISQKELRYMYTAVLCKIKKEWLPEICDIVSL